MGYFLFLLVTATLFVRPAEIFPAVHAWPIYEYLILACLAVSLPGVLSQLSAKSLAENPITACVIGLWAAVVLSHLAHFFLWDARMSGFMFFKIVVYYLLLVANVDSEERLKSFLRWLLLLITLAGGDCPPERLSRHRTARHRFPRGNGNTTQPPARRSSSRASRAPASSTIPTTWP